MEWEDDSTGVERKNKVEQLYTLFEQKAKYNSEMQWVFSVTYQLKQCKESPKEFWFFGIQSHDLHTLPVQLLCLYTSCVMPLNWRCHTQNWGIVLNFQLGTISTCSFWCSCATFLIKSIVHAIFPFPSPHAPLARTLASPKNILSLFVLKTLLDL